MSYAPVEFHYLGGLNNSVLQTRDQASPDRIRAEDTMSACPTSKKKRRFDNSLHCLVSVFASSPYFRAGL